MKVRLIPSAGRPNIPSGQFPKKRFPTTACRIRNYVCITTCSAFRFRGCRSTQAIVVVKFDEAMIPKKFLCTVVPPKQKPVRWAGGARRARFFTAPLPKSAGSTSYVHKLVLRLPNTNVRSPEDEFDQLSHGSHGLKFPLGIGREHEEVAGNARPVSIYPDFEPQPGRVRSQRTGRYGKYLRDL